MATKTIAWQTGSGNITLTYQGQGDGTISVQSDANDLSVARSQQITIETTNGSPVVTKTVTISQAAMLIPYVDLGLPSGLLWATCNIGATTPEGVGLYFSKGNIEGHEYGDGSSFNSSAYANTPGASVTGDVPANSTYDAARAILGGTWRLPTKGEFKELAENTDNEYSSLNGRNGWKFMKKSDHSVFVFFPAAGRYAYGQSSITGYDVSCMYWASTKQNNLWNCLFFNQNYISIENQTAEPYSGFQIRGVCNS